MRWRLACGLFSTCLWIACGGRTDLGGGDDDEGGAKDASIDVKKKDGATTDVTTSDVYQPLGKKCSPPTGAPPPPWTPDDASAPLHPPFVAPSGGPVIANPAFVAITFDGDDMRDALE